MEPQDVKLIHEFSCHTVFGRASTMIASSFYRLDASVAVPPPSGKERRDWELVQWMVVEDVLNWWFEAGGVRPVLLMLPQKSPVVRWSGGVWGTMGGWPSSRSDVNQT